MAPYFLAVSAALVFMSMAAAIPVDVSGLVLHERRSASLNWIKRDRIHSEAILPMRIGLVQSNLENGYDLLMDVSDPDSAKYGKYWTTQDIDDLFAPSLESVSAVRNWLESVGIDPKHVSQSANKQWIQFDAKTYEAESLLQTEYHFFEHAETGKVTIGCDEYHVHESVKDHIDYITPGIKLLASRGFKTSETGLNKRTFGWGKLRPIPPLLEPLPLGLDTITSLSPFLILCDTVITPPCIEAMYNFSQASSAVPGNQLGIFEDLGDYYSQPDLNAFFLAFQERIPIGTHPTLEGIDGGTAPTNVANAGAESDLDFQISYPIIWPQNSVLFQTDDPVYEAAYTFSGFLNNFLDAIDGSYCNYTAFGETGNSNIDPPYPDPASGGYKGQLQCGVYKPTNVISISYGGQEADLPPSYQQRQCNEFMKLGMRGVSVVLASGDFGVGGIPNDDNNADGCLGPNGTIFNPGFPATCPYITTVGSTLLTGDPREDEETATTRFGSGGGFSNIYPIPNYQTDAVAHYFATAKPPYPYYTGSQIGNGVYNRSGRGYPDVSAVGDNIVIFNKGLPTLIGGTSASAPVFASILTRINDARLSASKPTIGFVNPTLYKNPQVLHDITSGNNPGCNTTGFSAAQGWDPVTGLGTPNYPAMLNLFMSL